jgi:hypothetical protein
MLDWAIRYEPIVSFINKRKDTVRNVLEIGSGSYGLAHYLDHKKVIGVDISFPSPVSPNIVPVTASAAKLPFVDNAFDIVVSSDMMEHLDEATRKLAVQELARVASRYVIIGFPCGDAGKKVDRKIEGVLRKRGIPLPPWLTEHFIYVYPRLDTVMDCFPTNLRVLKTLKNDNVCLHMAVILAIMSRRYYKYTVFFDTISRVRKLSWMYNSFKTYRRIIFAEKKADR